MVLAALVAVLPAFPLDKSVQASPSGLLRRLQPCFPSSSHLCRRVPKRALCLPRGLPAQEANTGVLLLDVVPLLTMLPCLPTLHLYWRRRRFGDLAMFGVGEWSYWSS